MATGAEGDVLGHFRVAYETVLRFPLLIAPPLVVGILGFALLFFIGGGAAVMGVLMGGMMGGGQGMAAGGIAGLALGLLVFGLTMSVLGLLSSSVVVVMARDALAGREPTVGEAFGVVVGRLGALVGAFVLSMMVIGIGFLLFVIPGVLAAVLLIFTLPAVLLDNFGAVQAMRRSVAIVRRHVGPVIGLVVGSLLVIIGVAIASWIARVVPFFGDLASFVLNGAALSYLTVVAVGLYRTLAAS